jgi:protein-tyrosine phosphatase
MIDIHTHILPGVDDGARDLDAALAMVEVAVADGITTLVATPHILQKNTPETEARCQEAFAVISAEIKKRNWPIELRLGGEWYLQNNLVANSASPLFFLGTQRKYVLIELAGVEVRQFTDTAVFELGLRGFCPVLAHPERNATLLTDMERVADLASRGVLLQVNAGSLLGMFGREAKQYARRLLRRRLVHCVASDAHDLLSRKPVLSHAYAWVAAEMGTETAEALFRHNPRHILAGEAVGPAPLPEAAPAGGWVRKLVRKIFKL